MDFGRRSRRYSDTSIPFNASRNTPLSLDSPTQRVPTVESIIDLYGERPLPPLPKTVSSFCLTTKRSSSYDSSLSPKSSRKSAFTSKHSSSAPTPVFPKFVTGKDVNSAKRISQSLKMQSHIPQGFDDSPRLDLSENTRSPPETTGRPRPAKPAPFTVWEAPPYRPPQGRSNPQSPNSNTASEHTSVDFRSHDSVLKSQPVDYFSLFQHESALIPPRGMQTSSSISSDVVPLLSPRITDFVSDQAALHCPLRADFLDAGFLSTPTKSHFSPAHSSIEDLTADSRNYQLLDKQSIRPLAKNKALSTTDEKLSSKNLPNKVSRHLLNRRSGVKEATETGEVQKAHTSFQQGLTDMLETLQRFSTPFSSSLPQQERRVKFLTSPHQRVQHSQRRPIPKEIRSPAIPLTPYQKYGIKALEQDSKPSTIKRFFQNRKRHSKVLPGHPPRAPFKSLDNGMTSKEASKSNIKETSKPVTSPLPPPRLLHENENAAEPLSTSNTQIASLRRRFSLRTTPSAPSQPSGYFNSRQGYRRHSLPSPPTEIPQDSNHHDVKPPRPPDPSSSPPPDASPSKPQSSPLPHQQTTSKFPFSQSDTSARNPDIHPRNLHHSPKPSLGLKQHRSGSISKTSTSKGRKESSKDADKNRSSSKIRDTSSHKGKGKGKGKSHGNLEHRREELKKRIVVVGAGVGTTGILAEENAGAGAGGPMFLF